MPEPIRYFMDQHYPLAVTQGLRQRGIEVLTGPTLHLQHIGRVQAARIEEQLAQALRAEGLFVQGGH